MRRLLGTMLGGSIALVAVVLNAWWTRRMARDLRAWRDDIPAQLAIHPQVRNGALKSEFELNVGWHLYNARTNSKAQYSAANAADRRNYWIGVPTVVLGAVVSTAIFSALSRSPNSTEKIVAGTLAALAAALAAVQTFFNFSAKAEAHRAAGAQYGDVRRRCEHLLFEFHLMPDGPAKARFAIDEYAHLLDRMADLAANSPDAAKYWDRAEADNKRVDEEERRNLRDRYVPGIGGALLSEADTSPSRPRPQHQRD
jgi:hypothetical protein